MAYDYHQPNECANEDRVRMLSFEEQNKENHRITELSNVLRYLVKDRSMCDSGTCCDLFYRYLDELLNHIDGVEKKMYPPILTSGDQDHINMVNNFMEGSQQIKRIIKQYKRHWCAPADKILKISDHVMFLKETDGLFDLVLERLQDETEKLYPVVRKLAQD